MYRIFGWINVAVVAVMIAPFVLRWISLRLGKSKQSAVNKCFRFMRRLHKPLGGLLFASALVHAVLVLSGWRLHTGTILGFIVIIISIFGLLFFAVKKKWVVSTHKIFAYILIALVLVHLIFPSAIYQLFGV